MPTKESMMVAKSRMRFDRLSVLVEKGGRHLFRVMALREGVNISELIRRAVLARAGINVLPYPAEFEKLSEVKTKKEARIAIRTLQAIDQTPQRQEVAEMYAAERPTSEYTIFLEKRDAAEFQSIMAKAAKAIREFPPGMTEKTSGIPVTLTGKEVIVLRRALANMWRPEDLIDEE